MHEGPFAIDTTVNLAPAEPDTEVILRGSGEGALLRVQGRDIDVGFFGLTLADGGNTRSGGCVWIPNGARVVVSGCVVSGGTATSIGGGGIAIRRGELIVRESRFVDCTGRRGAAIYIGEQAEATVVDCTFERCRSEHGGPVWNDGRNKDI